MDIHRKHACHVADAEDASAGQFPVHIALQRDKIIYILHMLFLIENGLVQVGNAPSLGYIVPEYLCQLFSGRSCNGISPGAEGHQKLSVLVKCHIAVHHG